MIDIKVPSPGESITEVIIAQWLAADGDFVAQFHGEGSVVLLAIRYGGLPRRGMMSPVNDMVL